MLGVQIHLHGHSVGESRCVPTVRTPAPAQDAASNLLGSYKYFEGGLMVTTGIHPKGFTLREAIRAIRAEPLVRVLVVDDDQPMRDMIVESLRGEGYEATPAVDGAVALRRLRDEGSDRQPRLFDLVIADFQMPGLNGLQLLSELRQTPWAPSFILITAFGSEQTHSNALRLGAWAVLDKPFELHDLHVAVRNSA